MKKICVIGLGYIGLPTACMLANNGFNVLGVDIKEDIIRKLNSGTTHINEPELDKIFQKAFINKKLIFSNNLSKSDVFIISVPTPLTKQNKAELKFVKDAVEKISQVIEKNNLIILESTSPPGTSRNIVGEKIFKNTGLKAGKDFYLAFCPERVLPGKIVEELVFNDRIIGGISKESSDMAKNIYASFVKGNIFVTDLEVAEFVKLAENTYRDANIAFSNELALICEQYNINIWEVINLANMHPRVNILSPGPGVGGHCIPIDPWFILENIDMKNTLIEKSRNINDNMPIVISGKILKLLKDIKNPKVTLFGASYKENVGDSRESPAIVIYDYLKNKNIDVRIYDPLVESFKFQLSDFKESLENSDMIVILVGHNIFKNNSLEEIGYLMRNKNIFDTRNFFIRGEAEKKGFNYYSI